MKKKICIFALLLISACSEPLQESEELFLDIQDDEEISSIIEFSPEEIRLIEEIANNSPKISEENAQQTALQILGLSNEKSNSPQNLMSTIICNPKINTKSLRKSYTAEADTAIYIFNSPDDNGFAILSADLRVPDQILAYSDNGNFEIDSENPAMEYFLELAKDYVANCIEEAEQQKDSLTESICQKLGIVNDSIQQVINNMTKSTEIQRIKCTTVGLPKIVSEDLGKVNPLIKTQWHQHSPYNLLCNGNNAGCVPIAIAQLLVYWHYPDVFNGYRFNWEVMEIQVI
ncbi:MAG: C10 family peptidase [Bacteroidales bacterium]|nr:C10 family peptidase [Bacteroidales bacterium]